MQANDPERAEGSRPPVEVELGEPGAAVVSLRGEHDLGSRELVGDALARAAGHGDVLVDLTDCSFIDSTVIGAIVGALQRATEAGTRLELVVPADATALQRVVQVAGLPAFMRVHETRAAGLAALS